MLEKPLQPPVRVSRNCPTWCTCIQSITEGTWIRRLVGLSEIDGGPGLQGPVASDEAPDGPIGTGTLAALEQNQKS